MAVSEDKCTQCGTRYRQRGLDTTISPSGSLDADGTFMGLPYWFCSVECYKKAVSKHIANPRYGFDKRPQDDEEYCERVQEALVDYHVKAENIFSLVGWKKPHDYIKPEADAAYDAFITKKEGEIAGAEIELQNHLFAEWMHQLEEEKAKQEKESEKRKAEMEREQQKLNKLLDEKAQLDAEEAAFEEVLRPKPIPENLRLEHTIILGASGSGKTTKLQNDILRDFVLPEFDKDGYYDPNPNPPAYIIIDPKGLMVERLSRLDIYDNLVIVDPLDAPALNLFQKGDRDPAQLISDFSYIFSTTKQKLTGKQAVCFSFCARLLFTVAHANLETLLDLLDDRTNKKPPNPRFLDAISHLSPIHRRFFENDFYSTNYASTREEVKARVYGVAQNDVLAAMFNARTRKLDVADCIKQRKIVLVNTRMSKLSEDHQTLGRYIIALVQDAIQSRSERHPVYLVVDEFQEFADAEKTPKLLRLIREYGGGAVLAFQNMYCAELDDDTRNAISTNTSIKYASSPEGQDLNYMARDMRCQPELLKQMHKSETHANFACYVRGMKLDHPFVVQEEFGWIDKWPKMTDEDYREMRAVNKAALQDDEEIIACQDGHAETNKQKAPEEESRRVSLYTLPTEARPKISQPPKPAADRDTSGPATDSDPSQPSKWKR